MSVVVTAARLPPGIRGIERHLPGQYAATSKAKPASASSQGSHAAPRVAVTRRRRACMRFARRSKRADIERHRACSAVRAAHASSTPSSGAAMRARSVAHVRLRARHRRVDAVGDPAGQRAAIGGDRARAEQRMIEAAQPQADHQHTGSSSARARSACISVSDSGATSRRRLRRRRGRRRRASARVRGARSASSAISTPASRAAMCGAIGAANANGLQSA